MKNIFGKSVSIYGIIAVIIMLSTCDDVLNLQVQKDKAVVSFSVTENTARTVFPLVSLDDVVSYQLLGGRNGAVETELLEFTTMSTSLTLDIGTWNFTLNAFNESGQLILQGKVQDRQINLTSNNQIGFSMSALKSGTGNIQITLNFPIEADITRIKTNGDIDVENFTIMNNGNFTYTKNNINAGDYVISFELYTGDVLRTVISELILVRNNLTSSKIITIVDDNIKQLPYSTAKEITAFSLPTNPVANGIINETAKTINVTVPYGTNVTCLTPTVTHTGVSYTPTEAINFSSPVTYTVTAEDGSTQNYIVTVSVALNTAKAITAFTFPTNPVANGIINETAKTISITVPYGTSVTSLTPTITHTGSGISPTGARNFSSPVTYTVTAADGNTQNYTVTVSIALNPAKAITVFTFPTSPVSNGVINETSKTISVTVPYGTNVTSLTPNITHTGSNYSPTGARNFSSPVSYTVTAADGTTQNYTVTVSAALNPAKVITTFTFPTSPVSNGVINEIAKTISITVPHGTSVTSLTPTVTHTGASYSPTGARNFSSPVTYTVTAEDGSTQNYTVTVNIGIPVNGIEYYWIDAHGSLVTTSGGSTSIASGESLAITAQGTGYTVRQWHLNGVNTGHNGNTYNFSSTTVGKHTIGLFVEKDGKLYNTNIIITVSAPVSVNRTIKIDMYDAYGDGWNASGALRIVVNGNQIANNITVTSFTNTYTFSVNAGDLVQVYWVVGTGTSYQYENSFIIYYENTPPSPQFFTGSLSQNNAGPTSWNGTGSLLHRVRTATTSGTVSGTLQGTANNTLLGSFTVQ